jgi:integrase/recombinase XerD
MDTMRGIYAEETWRTRERRYKRMERKIIELKEKKIISTMSPKSMTEEDVRVYILHAKESLAPSDLVHEINSLRKLLLFAGNSAVDICLNHNPGLKPVVRNHRKPSMDDEVYRTILERSKSLDLLDFDLVRAYTLVLLCINTGTRNKEIRFADVEDLDTDSWILSIIHVKGEASYGQPREVPIPPEIRGLVLNYLLLRKKWMLDKNVDSPALFPSAHDPSGYLSGNSLRRFKAQVESHAGVEFDLRQCRRTFGQRYLDLDLDIESVSVLMGHSSTKTTEGFYSRRKLDKAVSKAMDVWKDVSEDA